MAVPKRKKSKSRTRKGRSAHFSRDEVKVIKTKDGKGYKRPHIEEREEL